MTYWRLHYHLVWSTFDHQPTITPDREKIFYGVLYQKAKELDIKIHAAGNTEDHVHIVVSIPPKLSIADTLRHFKGASAFAINHADGSDAQFEWQEGYGALSIGERSLPTVMAYASRQKEHHKLNTEISLYEKTEED